MLQITDKNKAKVYQSEGKPSDDFSYNFEGENRITMCFSTRRSEETSISFRYQVGNELKPINKSPRTEYVTSSNRYHSLYLADDVNNLADKLQYVATEIYAMQDEQRYTREKQHNYKQGMMRCFVDDI